MHKTPFTRSKNYLDRNIDGDPDRIEKDLPVYMRHPLFNQTKRITLLFIVQSFLHRNPPNISGLKLSRTRSRSSVYTGQNFSIQIVI